MVESLFHARDRFLLDARRIVPREIKLKLALVSEHEIYPNYIEYWGYALTDFSHNDLLSEPEVFKKLDVTCADRPNLRGDVKLKACREGELNGVALWFNAQLAPGVRLSSDPWSPTHWKQCFALIDRPMMVYPGDVLSVTLDMVDIAIGVHLGRGFINEGKDGELQPEGYAINLTKRIEGASREGKFTHIFVSEAAEGELDLLTNEKTYNARSAEPCLRPGLPRASCARRFKASAK